MNRPQLSTTERTLRERVESFFNAHRISVQDGIVVAFSGGSDSLSLLLILSILVPSESLRALYVDHRLRSREEQEKEIELNKERCRELGIPFELVDLGEGAVALSALERGNGIEESARHLRYKVLREARDCYGFRYIATAHTRSDLLETLLMRVFQGSRMNFSNPIQEVTSSGVIRPLLEVDRQEIEVFLSEQHLSGVQDSTNENTAFLRNGVRRTLIPALSRVFPGWRKGLMNLNEEFSALTESLEQTLDSMESNLITKELTGESVVIQVSEHLLESPLIFRRLLYRAYSLLSLPAARRISSGQIEEIMKMARSGTGHPVVRTPFSYVLFDGKTLIWKKGEFPLSSGYRSLVYSEHTLLSDSLVLNAETREVDRFADRDKVWIPVSCVSGTLVARSVQDGDVIILKDGEKSVSALLSQWGVAWYRRWEVPLLVDDKGVLAVMAEIFGGKNRVSRRVLAAPLAPEGTTLYSVRKDKG